MIQNDTHASEGDVNHLTNDKKESNIHITVTV